MGKHKENICIPSHRIHLIRLCNRNPWLGQRLGR